MSEKWRDDRTLELTISSPSVEGTKKVLLLLPKSWSKTSDQKWPTLWLLHGGGGNQVDWLKNTDVASLTKNLDLIVVMPETSDCSAYSDWWNDGKLGKPAWETYLTKDVREILESGYKANENRAIAGLSMGGLGALKLAANHPKMFQAAASFSGNVDILHRYNNSLTGPDYPGLGCISKWKSINDWKRVWGDPQVPAQKEIWKRNNPYDQAEKLSQLHYLYVSSGTGFGSPLKVGNQFDLIEQEVNRQAHGLVEKLNQLHIPVASHFYSGNHSWPYWKQELHKALPGILNALHVDGDHKQ
ncbi:alpha/beta hydrolase [Seinonella peptonophila]|nr:alpha/beta hydrolase family protein [Seinonella peptonophila]